MFQQEAIQVPVLGLIEKIWPISHLNCQTTKYYIFKEGAKNLVEDLKVPFLGEVPLVQSIREAGDIGRPAALQEESPLSTIFEEINRNVVQETVSRNENHQPLRQSK